MHTDFGYIMDMLGALFGDEFDVYFHDGYATGSDDFWHEDQDWDEDNPETYKGLMEEQISEDTMQQAGFSDEAEAAVWFKEDIASEGDRVDYKGESYLVISSSNFRAGGNVERQLLGVRSIDV